MQFNAPRAQCGSCAGTHMLRLALNLHSSAGLINPSTDLSIENLRGHKRFSILDIHAQALSAVTYLSKCSE